MMILVAKDTFDTKCAWLTCLQNMRMTLCRLKSQCPTICPSTTAANDPFVAKTIASASAIFIMGGDQSTYVNDWQNTPVQTALDQAAARGVPIGGTSAGLAVLGRRDGMGSFYRQQALREGGRVLHEEPGFWIIDWP